MAQKSRAAKLKDLKMPGKRMAEEEAEMDLALDELEGVEGEMIPAEEEMDMDAAAEEMEMSALEDVSDEELMQEMQRRGLGGPMSEEMPEEDVEQDIEEDEDDEV